MLGSFYLLMLNGAILSVCAVFFSVEQQLLLTALMLFLPLLDKEFRKVKFKLIKGSLFYWLVVVCMITGLISIDPSQLSTLVVIMFFTALPEEWFFRRYFQQSLRNITSTRTCFKGMLSAPWLANIATSLLFTLLHLPTQGLMGISVFIPSLFLGWLYQLRQDFVLVVLVHGLFNLFFIGVFARKVI